MRASPSRIHLATRTSPSHPCQEDHAMPANPWALAFGAELNLGHQSVTAAVANGLGNEVGGHVKTSGTQYVGDTFDYGSGPDINIGVQTVTAAVGNGAFNTICGDVTTGGYQDVGDSSLLLP